MSTLYKSLSMNQITDLISAVGDKVTVLVQGEIGSGKSSILKDISKRFPNHHTCYVDITTKDVGDFLVPKVRSVDGMDVCSFIPNEEFGFHVNKPVIIMLDEIGKAGKAVMNACLRLMLERKLGVFSLPKGSIVFGTTNLAVEGVGDLLPPHARNRVSVVKMRKPIATEWVENFAIPNNIDPAVIGTVLEFPTMFASFEDYNSAEQNNYIFDPRSPKPAFVSPRSMEKASDIVKVCRIMGDEVLTHALIGTIGEKAALDMLTMIKLDGDLPLWKDIVANPTTTHIPKGAAACCMLIAKATMNIEDNTCAAWMQYLSRMTAEAQGLFARMITRNSTPKRSVVMRNKEFTDLIMDKQYLF